MYWEGTIIYFQGWEDVPYVVPLTCAFAIYLIFVDKFQFLSEPADCSADEHCHPKNW